MAKGEKYRNIIAEFCCTGNCATEIIKATGYAKSIVYGSVLQTFFIKTHFPQPNFFATPKKRSSPRIDL